MGRIISVANQKGGVGKTTTSMNMGVGLAKKGKKVLLIDFDPQSSLTVALGFNNPDEIQVTMYDLIRLTIEEDELPPKEKYIKSVGENISLIPCNIQLSAAEATLVNTISREFVLKSIIDQIKDDYDYIIIDTLPSLGMLNINSLVACDTVIIPLSLEFMSAKGLELFLMNVVRVRKKLNSNLKIEGILLTMYRTRTRLANEVLNMIVQAYGKDIHIFNAKISLSIKVGEAVMNNKSVLDYAPENAAAQAYQEFVDEVLKNG
ncbi:MAG: ParA family protein [Cellulosilyticaceae bacterium]